MPGINRALSSGEALSLPGVARTFPSCPAVFAMNDPEWWAVLGPVPAPSPAGIIPVPHDRAAELGEVYKIGPVTIRSGGKRLTEYVRGEPHQMQAVTWFESWPVTAEGCWPGNELAAGGRYEQISRLNHQDGNLRVAAMWLHRVVCLLSLAWGEGWNVRSAPVDSERMPVAVPEDWLAPPIARGGDPGIGPYPRKLPSWVVGAWNLLEGDPALSGALSAWHQGVLMMPLFPSYALIAFCGAIETISQAKALREQVTYTPVECPACGHIDKSHAWFWATVTLVRSQDQVAGLRRGRNPYTSRSKTAHGATTHGIETAFGAMHGLIYEPPGGGHAGYIEMDLEDETQRFMWKELPAIRSVASDLLLKVLDR